MQADQRGSSPTLGVRLPNSGPFAEPSALLSTAEHAEALGYNRVWVHDHVSWPREKLTHFATGSVEACADQDPNFFESVSTSGLPLTAWPTVAVYVIVEPSTTEAGALVLRLTVVVSASSVTLVNTVPDSATFS